MDTQLNIGWESGNDKQTMYFVFVIKSRHKFVSHDNGKITQKAVSKLFPCDYLATHYSMAKWLWNVNIEEIDTEPSTGENDGFWLLPGIAKLYIRENIIMAVFREANSHSVDICRLQKNQNCKRRSWRKTDSNLDFSQAAKRL